ncbi:tRNA uridine-5-carboxymethylaminomethyl(34) synthesis GTPase MnmE [Methylocaldum sp.]|uniref:tRNA uridine-5-carboxymethylaminomethyl(34) synthesis GTPase MnmE n=1 Tax=Methylocaldum sp. TaxID=1969727 RepID=UPI002D724E0C|nr:tRNA uridine-5-carboxymethylaminomethyl(34) synthesis GTPase MnmE [Methylocaldum sp.]HYE36687.1 tRNA uridine-5-carboxymethylaminomethyl(34) synthesis GTPase MnmE [Methylocaldum sp.]
MNTLSRDTIAAIATPPGRGGIGVVRISGNAVPSVIQAVLQKDLEPRYAHYSHFYGHDGSVLDTGLALYFPSPHSFTGEDVLELHAHGGPVVLDLLLRRVLTLGVRLARPGEFSERAFLNDKIDLAQAEAIADLIESTTEQAARSAQRSLQGEFSTRIHQLVEALIELRLYVEASIDFADEDIDFLSEGHIAEKLAELMTALRHIRHSARQGCLLREGMTVVIAGRPNAGKSSLLNQLAGREAAIVTEIAGTTRDTLREHIQIDGMPLHVVDTAGLRDSEDIVEREGIRRAQAEIHKADRILLLIDDRTPEEGETLFQTLPADIPVTRVYNKIDLTGKPDGFVEGQDGTAVYLSAKTGEGMEHLRRHLKAAMGYDSEANDVFIARRRHLDALSRAQSLIESAQTQLKTRAAELLAEDLREAQHALSEITGEFTNEDLLGRIFSSFCIGK